MIKKEARLPPQAIKAIASGLLGALAGGLHGYYVSPNVLDYAHIPSARKSSTMIDTLGGAAVGLALGSGKLKPSNVTLPAVFKALGMYGGGQMAPVIQATMAEQRQAMRESANAAKVTSIPYNLERFGKSNVGKGLAGGAAVAGLGGMATGLLRRRTDEEEMKQKSRAGMVTADTLKYLVPALAAGGVIGSLHGD